MNAETKIKYTDAFKTSIFNMPFDDHLKNKENYIKTLDDFKANTLDQGFNHHRTFITTTDLHSHPAFDSIIENISTGCKDILDLWKLEKGTKLGISKMWGSVTQSGGILMSHTVPFTFLYGMYFVSTPPDSGNLVIDNPAINSDFFAGLPITEITSFNTGKFISPMPEGMIVLLPGYLNIHSTVNNHKTDSRYILHFALTILR